MHELFPDIPEDFAALSDDELQKFIDEADAAVEDVASDPASFVSDDLSAADLFVAAKAAAQARDDARAALASRTTDEPVEADDDAADEFGEFAALLSVDETAEGDDDDADDDDAAETVTASADPVEPVAVVPAPAPAPAPRRERRSLPVPARSRRPVEAAVPQVSLTAAASYGEYDKGEAFPSMDEIARVMQSKKNNFGIVAEGTHGEKVPVVRASWKHLYPAERTLSDDPFANEAVIADQLNPLAMKRELARRRDGALVASGGLCAPVTPYYNLQMISVADRPVRAALPAFNADRGGIRNARPAALSAITTGVGMRTAAEDGAGGTEATKTCQVVDCPPFEETDVQIIFHCLQFGNLGARTFPERVTQWNNLTLAAHARLAESLLLTGIDTASTQVTAHNLGLGASSTLFSQIMTASSGMRSRNRMASDSVLRILLPWWSVYEIVSDVFRGQFDRFDVDQAKVVALLRSIDVEPSFYIDGADGRAQVYGSQSDGSLLPFPSTIVWYLYPEGSFLYLDGGVLELGLVRDSVLNSTNDFQIFGETFENVAFIGVESLAVETTTCDSGTVSLPHAVPCPIDYAHTS